VLDLVRYVFIINSYCKSQNCNS